MATKKTTKKTTKAKKPVKKTAKKKTTRAKKPKGMVQITSPIRSDISFYVAAELQDDKIIEQEILGEAIETYIYEFCPNKCDDFKKNGKCGHNTTKGMSAPGVREVVRQINRNSASGHKIRVAPEPPIINRDVDQNGQKGIEVMVYAEDLVAGSGSWGSKFEPYIKYGKKNVFALELALTKAQRNAERALIPEKLALAMITKLIKEKRGVMALPEAPDSVTIDIEPQKTTAGQLFDMTMERVEQIRYDKEKLQEALSKVDTLPLSPEQKKKIQSRIEICLAGK